MRDAFQIWVDAVCGQVRFRPDHKAIEEELRVHYEDHVKDLLRLGRPRELAEDLRFPEEGSYDDIALMYKLLAGAKRVAYHGLPKYTFRRHEGNNSAWTTNHSLLNRETLEEYLTAYRTRTEWLGGLFPESGAV